MLPVDRYAYSAGKVASLVGRAFRLRQGYGGRVVRPGEGYGVVTATLVNAAEAKAELS